MFLPLHIDGGLVFSSLYILLGFFFLCHGRNLLIPQTFPKPICFPASSDSVAVLAWFFISPYLPDYVSLATI